MKVAITGSSGMIGTALRAQLEREGHDILPMRRGASDDPEALWNPADGWVRPGVLEGVDAVVSLAGVNIGEARWTEKRREVIRRACVDSVRVLVEHIATLDAPPSTLVSASGVGYYGDRGDEELTEESSRGEGFLADVDSAREAAALRAEASGVRVVRTRFGVVLSREGGALKKMLLPFRMGVGGRVASGRQWFSWISLEDVARALAHVLTSDLAGPVNVTARPLRNADFTSALGEALRRPTIFPVPAPTLRLLYGQMANETVLASQRAIPGRLESSGFEYVHPDIDSGLRAALNR